MSDPQSAPSPASADRARATLAARLAIKQRAGGIIVPIITVLFALLMGGIVVAATQRSVHKALVAFKEIFDGAGLNWLAHPDHEPRRTFPRTTSRRRCC